MSRYKFSWVLLILLLTGFVVLLPSLSILATADTIDLYPDADTFIVNNQPDTNFGSNTGLMVGKLSNTGLLHARIRFSGIPAGAAIQSATLRLYRIMGSGSHTLAVQSASRSWQESTLTWNTDGSTNRWTTPKSTYAMSTQTGYVSVDVTSHVQEWADGSRSNYGFHLSTDGTTGENHTFASRESATSSYWPKLDVTYGSSEHCYSCPTYDYGTYTPGTNYNTHSASFDAGGCRMYRFNLTSGNTYRFTTCEGGGYYSEDTVFTLYDNSCTCVDDDDDTCGTGSEIEYTPTSSGYYYLKVENYYGNAESYTLAYKREVTLLPTRFRGSLFVDTTAKIGIPILLEAKLERDNPPFFNDIAGETVHFEIYYSNAWHEISDDGIANTSFITDSNGIASVYYTAPNSLIPADYAIRARYDGSGTYSACSLLRTLTIKKPNWLVMIYLCADNNLEAASVEDFYDEMWEARNNDEVSICVLYDRSPLDESTTGYSSSQPFGSADWSSTRYYRFSNNSLIFNDWNEQNMGSQTVLQSFVDTAMGQCSADRVALILWNHGSGWKLEEAVERRVRETPIRELLQEAPMPQILTQERAEELPDEGFKAVCFDDTGDRLLLQEIRGVLDSITNQGANPIDVLGYDACVMGMLEVAYDVSQHAEFLVASEDTEDYDGWEYHLILGTDAIGSTTTAQQWGQKIVDESIQSTLGCWNLSYADNRFSEIASMATRVIEIFSDSEGHVTAARTASHKFRAYGNGPECYVDLRQFATELANRTSDTTLQSRAETVASGMANTSWRVAWKSTHTDANTLGGLSIYFPEDTWDSGDYDNYFQDGYLLFTSSSSQYWDEFLKVYFDETNPTCQITAPNIGGWHAGDIWVSATADDDNEVKYVEFEYSLNYTNWYPLPGPDSPDGIDWYGNNGWGLTFRTMSTPQHGTINDSAVWVRARACDKAGNIGEWDDCNMSFGVDNNAPAFGSWANTDDPKPGTYEMLQTITDSYSGVRDDDLYPRFYYRWNNSTIDTSHYDGVVVGNWDGSYYKAAMEISSDHVGDRIYWRVRALDSVGNESWSDSHDGGVVQDNPPAISVTPSSRDFGSVEVGSYADRTFTVENTGSGTLTGNASVPAPFSIFSGGSYILTAGQTQTVMVRFSPTTTGAFERNVTFTGGGGDTRPVSGEGTSTAVAPAIEPISDHSTTEGSPYIGPTPALVQGTQPITWSIVTHPGGMVINSATGVVNWPNPTATGSPHEITICATNTEGHDDETWQLTVVPTGACTYFISPTSEHFSSSGGTGSVSVTTESGCDWTATSNDSWISITSGSSGSGNGTVYYSVSSNSSASSRTGTMTIAGETFTVTQSGNDMAGVFIADFGSNEVVKVYPDGTECFRVGGFNFLNQGAVSANLSKGTVMVADSNNDRIVEVSEDGKVISSAYGFLVPLDVSVNPSDGTCWVADRGHHQVVKLSSDLTELVRLGGFNNPLSVSVNSTDGSCWVGDGIYNSTNQVVKLSPNGEILFSIVGGFNIPLVCVNSSDGTCWVADQYNGRVVKLSPDGEELFANSNFSLPFSVSVNVSDGACWVADRGSDEIVKLSANGEELLRVGGFDFLYYEGAISVNSNNGTCWVADSGNSEVVKLSSEGTELLRVTGFDRPHSISVCPQESNAKDKLYFPHIASGGDWETEIAIINNNVNQTVSGELKAYNDAGQEVSNSIPLTLDPHVRREITIGDEFTYPDDIGYIIFEGYSDNIKGYTKFYIEGTYRVAVPAVKEINTGDIYISHIASNSDWWTGISLLNTSSSSISLTIEFDNGENKTITLAANEHRAFTIAELFNGQPQPDIQSAVIKNASGVIGLELFGSAESSGCNYLSGILLKDDTTSTIYYPHIASNTTWWTGIVAYNPSSSACDITITPYSAEGSPLTEQSLSIAGHGKYIGTAAGLSLPDGTAWLQIQATSAISGFELFGTQDENQLAGYTGVGISRKDGAFAKLEKDGWTGIAFVNIEDSSASVTLTAYDDSGTIVATETMNVSGYAKVVNIAEDIFTQDISTATYINYSSDKEVVGFQLNGSSGGMMLDGLPGM